MSGKRRSTSLGWAPAAPAHSPLRRVDPRTKLALSLSMSLAVMLPLEQLVAAVGVYMILLTWGGLLAGAARQVWRLKWVLLGLFVIDWWFVSLELALSVTLWLSLLASTFILFFSTTTPGEMRLALEWLRVPYRYAFSLSLAFQSLSALDQEWRNIREAQQARGAWQPGGLAGAGRGGARSGGSVRAGGGDDHQTRLGASGFTGLALLLWRQIA